MRPAPLEDTHSGDASQPKGWLTMESHVMDIHISKTVRLNYLLHLPAAVGTSAGGLWPTILFLHGRGESGDDPSAVMRQGLPAYVAQQPVFPFIVIAPQCPWGTWWPELAESLTKMLDACVERFPVDPERLYLTGLSMGGFGTWYLAAILPRRFAAIAPICGGGYGFHGFPQRVCALRDTPVWAFHGAKDDVVPVSASEDMVSALRECGGEVQLTIYPEAGHDSWTNTYTNPELYRWFLQHPRR
jgi:predicted peptidase